MMKKCYTFSDVCLVPQYSDIDSRLEPNLETWLTKNRKMNIPILAANMDSVISNELADVLIKNGSIPIFHRFTTQGQKIKWLQKYGGENIAISTGLVDNNNDGDLYELIVEHGARLICIDIAHGHSRRMMKMIEELKNVFQHENTFEIIAGNICTPNAYIDLVQAGADACKIGVGPGSCCLTRVVTGHGISQFTAIQECAEESKKYRIPIIADGGIQGSSDIVKALAAGASSVMIGKMFALTEESAAEKRDRPGTGSTAEEGGDRKEAKYRGQASEEFQNDFYGGLKNNTVAEGDSFWATVSGSAQDLLGTLLGGCRSGMTYGGARDLKELVRKATFRITTDSYAQESNIRPT